MTVGCLSDSDANIADIPLGNTIFFSLLYMDLIFKNSLLYFLDCKFNNKNA